MSGSLDPPPLLKKAVWKQAGEDEVSLPTADRQRPRNGWHERIKHIFQTGNE